MDNTAPQKECQRSTSRLPTEAFVTCRPFTSDAGQHAADGVLRNFSSDGFYIESTRPFASGTILLMRTIHYPPGHSVAGDEQPRSICMAEVKWVLALAQTDAVRFGIGGRYLDK